MQPNQTVTNISGFRNILQKVVSGGLRVSPNFVRQHCTAEAHDIVKQALLQNKNFFRVFANVVDIANGHDIQVKLNSEQFYISFRGLPRDNKPDDEDHLEAIKKLLSDYVDSIKEQGIKKYLINMIINYIERCLEEIKRRFPGK